MTTPQQEVDNAKDTASDNDTSNNVEINSHLNSEQNINIEQETVITNNNKEEEEKEIDVADNSKDLEKDHSSTNTTENTTNDSNNISATTSASPDESITPTNQSNANTDEYGLPITETSEVSSVSSSRKSSVGHNDVVAHNNEEVANTTSNTTGHDNASETTSTDTSETIDMKQLKEKLPQVMHIFEHFIVVGLPNSKQPPRLGINHKPELLFYYPPDKQVPPKAHEFCFPNGITPFLIKRTPSCSSLNELLYGQPYLQSSEYFYTFVLTGESPLYGICVSKPELLSTIPNFFPDQPQLLEKKPTYITASRSYCLLSKIPLFHVHFDALMYLLAQDRLITITRELSSAVDDEELSEQNSRSTPTSTDNTTSTPDNAENSQRTNSEPQSSEKAEESNDSKSNDTQNETTETSITEQTKQESAPASPPATDNEYKHLVDKKNLLDILKFYSSLTLPSPGEVLNYSFPNEILKRAYNIPIGKNNDEVFSKSMSEWATIGLFMKLSLENILKVLGAVLLEQRVVFVSDNLSLISASCFAMQSFIYPFLWQGLFVPIIPQPLIDYLEAPVPFIAGAQVLRKKNFDGLIVDINNDKIIYNNCSQPPVLPEFKKLQKNLSSDQMILSNERNHNPIKNTPTQIEAVHRIYNTIQQYIWWLVKKIEISFSINEEIAADSLKIEQLKTKFLSTVSTHNKGFVSMLLDTQHFSNFLHSSLVSQSKEVPVNKN